MGQIDDTTFNTINKIDNLRDNLKQMVTTLPLQQQSFDDLVTILKNFFQNIAENSLEVSVWHDDDSIMLFKVSAKSSTTIKTEVRNAEGKH